MDNVKLNHAKKNILISIPILFIIGSAFHFLYELTSNNFIIGFFAPINESIFEHTKLSMLPIMLWWIIYYVFNSKKFNINKNKWFTASLISIITSILLIPFIFYFYTEAFGIESLIIDILILLISIALGQLLGLHAYNYLKGFNYKFVICMFILIIFAYVIFTLNPPDIPIFKVLSN